MKEKEQQSELEYRSLTGEIRASSESRTIEGVACVMEKKYNMGWYNEIVHAGAFEKALKESDIRCLVDHEPGKLIGRTTAGTLEVWVEGNELRYKVMDVPQTSVGNDLLISLQRGDLKESSFGFSIEKQRWETIENGDDWRKWEEIRHIDEIRIVYDVSPVTFPANPDTSVAKRSFEALKKDRKTIDLYKAKLALNKK